VDGAADWLAVLRLSKEGCRTRPSRKAVTGPDGRTCSIKKAPKVSELDRETSVLRRAPTLICIDDLDVDVLIEVDRLPTRDGKVERRIVKAAAEEKREGGRHGWEVAAAARSHTASR